MRLVTSPRNVVDGKKLEIHRAAAAVGVAGVGDERSDVSIDAELFVELAGECLFGSLSRLDLPAGELPFEGHGLVGTPLTDQDLFAAQNKSGGDKAHGLRSVLVDPFFHAHISLDALDEIRSILRPESPWSEPKIVRVNGLREGVEAADESRSRSIQQLIGNAVNPAVSYRAQVLPAPLFDDALQGHTIAGSAPCGYDHVGIGGSHRLGLGRRPRFADEFAARSLDELHDPELRVDQGLAPLLAIDPRPDASRCGAPPDVLDLGLHLLDQRLAALCRPGPRLR